MTETIPAEAASSHLVTSCSMRVDYVAMIAARPKVP